MANDAAESAKPDPLGSPEGAIPTRPAGLEELSQAPEPSLAAEFIDFLKHNKKWWLLPILVMIAMFGILIALAQTGVAPFIYTLF
jgi:uncharacterized protein DUF5989